MGPTGVLAPPTKIIILTKPEPDTTPALTVFNLCSIGLENFFVNIAIEQGSKQWNMVALLDCRAQISVINHDFVLKNKIKTLPLDNPIGV